MGRYDKYSNITVKKEVYDELKKLAKAHGLSVPDFLALVTKTYDLVGALKKVTDLLGSSQYITGKFPVSQDQSPTDTLVRGNPNHHATHDSTEVGSTRKHYVYCRDSKSIKNFEAYKAWIDKNFTLHRWWKEDDGRICFETSKPVEKEERSEKDACKVLATEKVIYESNIAGKIKNLDAYFSKVVEECGAEVLEVKDQRVAVEPNFWNEFKEKLSTLNTNDESTIKKVLGVKGHKLLKTLWEGGLIYYDSINSKWEWI
jgi:hypothetical protein